MKSVAQRTLIGPPGLRQGELSFLVLCKVFQGQWLQHCGGGHASRPGSLWFEPRQAFFSFYPFSNVSSQRRNLLEAINAWMCRLRQRKFNKQRISKKIANFICRTFLQRDFFSLDNSYQDFLHGHQIGFLIPLLMLLLLLLLLPLLIQSPVSSKVTENHLLDGVSTLLESWQATTWHKLFVPGKRSLPRMIPLNVNTSTPFNIKH